MTIGMLLEYSYAELASRFQSSVAPHLEGPGGGPVAAGLGARSRSFRHLQRRPPPQCPRARVAPRHLFHHGHAFRLGPCFHSPVAQRGVGF